MAWSGIEVGGGEEEGAERKVGCGGRGSGGVPTHGDAHGDRGALRWSAATPPRPDLDPLDAPTGSANRILAIVACFRLFWTLDPDFTPSFLVLIFSRYARAWSELRDGRRPEEEESGSPWNSPSARGCPVEGRVWGVRHWVRNPLEVAGTRSNPANLQLRAANC